MRLSAIWEGSAPLVLAPRAKAIEMDREGGWKELPTREALREVDRAQRLAFLPPLRHFVADCRVSHSDLRELKDHEVLDFVRTCIRQREMVVLRQGVGPGMGIDETGELRRLLAQIEMQARGRLSYRGRQYKLVLGDELAKVPGRDHYEVVGQADAQTALDGIASEQPSCADLLAKAKAKISKDWRPPSSSPEGLVLLQRLVVQANIPRDEGPALTPSQIQQMRAPKEEVQPLMSAAEAVLETSDVELPVAAEEEASADTSVEADDSEASPAQSAASAELDAPDGSAKTAEAAGRGDGESNESDEGNDGGADGTDAGTTADDSQHSKDSNDNGGGGESEGGGSPELW